VTARHFDEFEDLLGDWNVLGREGVVEPILENEFTGEGHQVLDSDRNGDSNQLDNALIIIGYILGPAEGKRDRQGVSKKTRSTKRNGGRKFSHRNVVPWPP
jgi:hypothetical protein